MFDVAELDRARTHPVEHDTRKITRARVSSTVSASRIPSGDITRVSGSGLPPAVKSAAAGFRAKVDRHQGDVPELDPP
jgi:hypothetical protein